MAASDLWDLPLEQLMQIPVTSVASGTTTPIALAASTVTVISRSDIRAIGATDLDQILETVPGLHVTRSDQSYYGKYIFRGIASSSNAEALLLINGIPVKSLFTGSRSNVWAGMPVKAIERIEVIRGPGSALYGADAFAGVINIHTRSARDIDSDSAGVRAGSNDTWGGWSEQKGEFGGLHSAFSVEYQHTNGPDAHVRADSQTYLDGLLGSDASLAPGPLNGGYRSTEMRLDLAGQYWQYRLGYQGRDDVGTTVGVADALDPSGLYKSDRINTDLTYDHSDWRPDWDLRAQVSFYHNTQEVIRHSLLFPRGAFGGAFPDGVIGNPSYFENQARAESSLAFHGIDAHIIRLGAGTSWGDVYKVHETKNFQLAPFGVLVPTGSVMDFSDTADAFLREAQRTALFTYVQDEWRASDTTALTTGVRYDHYSDFGDTTNPRIALVNAWRPDFSTRFSYGRAFHAPSFVDLYSSNNPVLLGNPDVDPETIDTWELSFTHQPTPRFSYSVTGFTYRIDDAIVAVGLGGGTGQIQNGGQRKGRGGEIETRWQASDQLCLVANASYQNATDADTGLRVGEAPAAEAYARIEWSPLPLWRWTTELQWTGHQPRAAGDRRPDLDDTAVLNLSLAREHLWQHLDLQLGVRNLGDVDVREPSAAPGLFIPDDYPMGGRTWLAEASWNW